MTSLLTSALEELRSHLPSAQGDPGFRVTRASVTRGGILQLEIEEEGRSRWFSFDDRGLIEQYPRRDLRLPLSAQVESTSRVLSYRPGRRLVITGTRDGKPVVMKGFRRRRSPEAARHHRVALSAASRSGFVVPRLVAHERSLETLVFDRIEGEPLVLSAGGGEQFFRIGAGLAAFQELGVQEGGEVHGVEAELGLLERLSARAVSALGSISRTWSVQFKRAGKIRSSLSGVRVGLCHRDLHDGQFLKTEQGTALLDYDLLCVADVALDPANLLAHLALRGMQGIRDADPASARSCGEALLEGYDPRCDDGFWIRLRFYEALTFLRLAMLYALRPAWASLTPNLIDLADRCLEDVERSGIHR